MSTTHSTQVGTVVVQDGTLPPSHDAKQNALAMSNFRPHEQGHKHAQGRPRMVERHVWYCSCGKSSNGCTYSSPQSAGAAGRQHRDAANREVA